VGVKGLKWKDLSYKGELDLIAHTPFHTYHITKDDTCEWPFILRPFVSGQSNYTSIADAKATAQADYEQRVRCALEAAPSAPPSREEGLREALPDGFVRVDVGLTNQIINDTLERAAKAVTVASEQPIHSAEMRYVAGHRLGVDRSLAAIRALSHANGGE
jgi:hypothetical protein